MNVLLLGDSIRMFYQKKVTETLGPSFTVSAPEENCRFSAYAFNSLRLWLPQFPVPDIIHWNFGLWDTAILYSQDGCFTPIEEYIRNMKRILRELKKTGARIILATTTPVTDEKEFLDGPMPPAHRNQDIVTYNQALLSAFADEDIVVNDLFSAIYPDREKFISEDMIHPNEAGVEVLGSLVSDAILKCANSIRS